MRLAPTQRLRPQIRQLSVSSGDKRRNLHGKVAGPGASGTGQPQSRKALTLDEHEVISKRTGCRALQRFRDRPTSSCSVGTREQNAAASSTEHPEDASRELQRAPERRIGIAKVLYRSPPETLSWESRYVLVRLAIRDLGLTSRYATGCLLTSPAATFALDPLIPRCRDRDPSCPPICPSRHGRLEGLDRSGAVIAP